MRAACLCAVTLLGLVPGCGSHAGRPFLVGVDDDTVRWTAGPAGLLRVDRDLGLDAVKVTLRWRPGEGRPSGAELIALRRSERLAEQGVRVVLAASGPGAEAPVTGPARERFCGFVAAALGEAPRIRDVVVWNEANSPAFWRGRPDPAAYAALLARCYDVLHRVRADANVIDSTAGRHDPAGFLRGLGDALRASGRQRPVVDSFGHSVYPEWPGEPPDAVHADATLLEQGDYERLVGTLQEAFAGTAQPPPGRSGVTIWYLEDGFQAAVPAAKRRYYRGRENVRRLLGAGAGQAEQLRAAILLAYCQPLVGAFFNFQLRDESRLAGWQSGVLYADGSRKPAYAALQGAVRAVHAGDVDCGTRP